MLTEVCAEIKNYFVKEIKSGHFEIVGGKIALSLNIAENQYFRIVGSVFNDGVHKNTVDLQLVDEAFSGSVWAMAVPPSVIALSDEIKAFNESDAARVSPYTSESFGGYSYTKATDSNGVPLTWQKAFASRLNKYRRISVL